MKVPPGICGWCGRDEDDHTVEESEDCQEDMQEWIKENLEPEAPA